MNAVEDQNGDVDRVAVYNFPLNKSMDQVLPKNATLAVKEPYYHLTVDGRVLIRIDHPSDLIQLKSDSSLIPESMVSGSMPSSSPTEMKEMGNQAFKRCDWQAALDFYSAALGLKQLSDGLRRTLHRNRSQARINLGHYELAVQDAVAAIIPGDHLCREHKSQNAKSLYRAGRAAYELSDFLAAKQYFSRALEFSPKDNDVSAHLDRTEKRLKEQNTGEYDFKAMSNSATKDHTILDHASFLSNTKIASAGGRGRGLFATKNVAPGDVIMVEKAFCATFERDVPEEKPAIVDVKDGEMSLEKQAARIYGTIDKIIHNPKQARQFLDLHDGGKFQNKVPKFLDGMATVDTFLVQAIDRLNGFDFPGIKSTEDGSGEQPTAAGIWLHVSHANHSCIPNADRSFIGDMMVVRATRDIKAGEEITLAHVSASDPYLERKERLSSYGIECGCKLCKTEKSIPNKRLSKRAKLVDDVDRFLATDAAGYPSTVPASEITKAEQLLAKLEGTYPDERYKRLPRLACADLSHWLCLVDGSPEERLKRALRGLRNFGYFVKVEANGITIDRSSAVVDSGTFGPPTIAASACARSGKMEAARQFQELRKEIYTILYACEDGLDEGK